MWVETCPGEGNEMIVGGKRMRGRRYLVINPSPAPNFFTILVPGEKCFLGKFCSH